MHDFYFETMFRILQPNNKTSCETKRWNYVRRKEQKFWEKSTTIKKGSLSVEKSHERMDAWKDTLEIQDI